MRKRSLRFVTGDFLHCAILQGVFVGRTSPEIGEDTFTVSLSFAFLITHLSACVYISNCPDTNAGEILM